MVMIDYNANVMVVDKKVDLENLMNQTVDYHLLTMTNTTKRVLPDNLGKLIQSDHFHRSMVDGW
jgi:hypothetical protein